MDIEFIITAVGTFDMKLVYSGESFACHQEHKNEWESHPERITSNQGISASEILGKKTKYVNEEGKWALYHLDIWEEGLECVEFRGGLAY
jgi:hypothetical protein